MGFAGRSMAVLSRPSPGDRSHCIPPAQVNNAGAYTSTKHFTKEGVAELCQVRPTLRRAVVAQHGRLHGPALAVRRLSVACVAAVVMAAAAALAP